MVVGAAVGGTVGGTVEVEVEVEVEVDVDVLVEAAEDAVLVELDFVVAQLASNACASSTPPTSPRRAPTITTVAAS